MTGGSRGLGRAIARTFALQGAHVAIGYVRAVSAAEETGHLVQDAGGTASLHQVDVRDRAEVVSVIGKIEAEHGLDVLVNNAGVVADDLALTMSEEMWQRVIDVNLNGTFHCARVAADLMVRRGGGAIVNVASVAALRASPGQVNYAAAKAGVLALTRTLASEVARYDVRVNAVVPGILDTGMGQRLNHAILRKTEQFIPARRPGTAEEVANAVEFLASDRARYVIGHALVVDGGLSL